MTRDEKIVWMATWCAKHTAALNLEGEVGFGRECVGILVGDSYPDYEWHDEKTYERLDNNGDVWTPPNAYHKGPYVAVLGRGEEAESELYDWLKWFDDNNFSIESGFVPNVHDPIMMMLGKHKFQRMVKEK